MFAGTLRHRTCSADLEHVRKGDADVHGGGVAQPQGDAEQGANRQDPLCIHLRPRSSTSGDPLSTLKPAQSALTLDCWHLMVPALRVYTVRQ